MLAQKFWRDKFLHLILQLVLECVLIAVGLIIIGQANVLFSAAIGLVVLYGLRCINGLMKIVVSTPIYYMSKKRVINQVVSQFYHHRLPVRNELAFLGGSEYMQEVAKSKDIPEELRCYLNYTLGELDGLKAAGAVAVLRMNAVLDAAIERYVSENNAHSTHLAAA